MDSSEHKNIKLVVDDEQSIYTPLNPEAEFNAAVKDYIRSKAAVDDLTQSINMTVISRGPLDEERFREAVSSWIIEEKAVFRRIEKETIRTMLGLLVFGSVFLVLSIALQNRFEVLKYSLLPILGSLALSKAAGILIIDMPTVKAQRRIINDMENNSVITFEYTHEETADPDKELV